MRTTAITRLGLLLSIIVPFSGAAALPAVAAGSPAPDLGRFTTASGGRPLKIGGVGVRPAVPGQNCAEPGKDRVDGSWARVMLQADAVRALEDGGATRVAVLSTGVDQGQPQLDDRVLDGADTVDNAGGADQDCTGTGTQVAGTISGRPGGGDGDAAGLSPGSTIFPVRVMPDDPAGSEPSPGTLARGILAAVQNDADVIVVAAPVYRDDPGLASAVSTALAQDVVIVAAAGDLGGRDDGNPDPYPASYPGVIGVGAIDQNGQISPTSQFGDYVDLIAPGVAVPTLQTGRGVVEASGTAIAAGFVGATTALLRARDRNLSAAEITRRLLATTSPAPSGPAFGAGVVSPYAALTAQVVDTSARRLPALEPAPVPDNTTELRRRAIAVNTAVASAALVTALLLVAAAVRRSRRRTWRPGLAPHLTAPSEPLEPGPPLMLLDTPPTPSAPSRRP
ncbi:S8 family serine peptidase [Actinoplanes subglobosus]|uniref:S8 family serine peptidase n=1 Tax=Actinoplanes subglobosus TaxID=1547892 RepID=A0ABV8IIQ9_9ACTN